MAVDDLKLTGTVPSRPSDASDERAVREAFSGFTATRVIHDLPHIKRLIDWAARNGCPEMYLERANFELNDATENLFRLQDLMD